MKRRDMVALALALLAVLFGLRTEGEAERLSAKLIRLHVVAHSDTEADQQTKLAVRDALLAVLNPLLAESAGREEAAETLRAALPTLGALAEQVSGQPAQVSLEQERFPTTHYPTFSLPAGEYLSLRVRLGAGEGHNWWCVVFPRLCGEETLTDLQGLSEEDLRLITGETVVRFKSLELLAWLKSLLLRGDSC